MSKKMQKNLIYHHSGKMTDKMEHFLKNMGFVLIRQEDLFEDEYPGFIIIDGESNLEYIDKAFEPMNNNIQLISFSPVKNLQRFILCNGKLIIDPTMVDIKATQQALERFFNHRSSVYIDENFTEIKNYFNFKVTNHLRVGHELDRLSLYAFENNFNVVNIRGYVDNLVFYLYYLKQSNIACIPFEVDYGTTGDDFVVQTHLFVKNFVSEYLIDSFGAIQAHDPIKFLLSQCTFLSDFFEVQYLPKVSKLVITGLWKKTDSVQRGFGSLMLHEVESAHRRDERINMELLNNWEGESEQVEGRIERIKDKLLPGHLFQILFSENYVGYFRVKPELAKTLEDFIIENFHPDEMNPLIEEISLQKIRWILEEFSDQDEIGKLHHVDMEHLQQRLQKKKLIDAFEEETEQVRRHIEEDPRHAEKLRERYSEEVTKKIVGNIDEDSLKKIIDNAKGFSEDDISSIRDLIPDDKFIIRGELFFDSDKPILVKGSKESEQIIQRILSASRESLSEIQESDVDPSALHETVTNIVAKNMYGHQDQVKELMDDRLQEKLKESYDDFLKVNSLLSSPNNYQNFLEQSLESVLGGLTESKEESNKSYSAEEILSHPIAILAREFKKEVRRRSEMESEDQMDRKSIVKESLATSLKQSLKDEIFKKYFHKNRSELAEIISKLLNISSEINVENILTTSNENIKHLVNREIQDVMMSESVDGFFHSDSSSAGMKDASIKIQMLTKQLHEEEFQHNNSQKLVSALKAEISALRETNFKLLKNRGERDKSIDRENENKMDQFNDRLEFEKKENEYIRDLEKAHKQIHVRDQLLDKIKLTHREELLQKEEQIRDLNKKVVNLIKLDSLESERGSTKNFDRIDELTSENTNLQKQIEMFKRKFQELTSTIEQGKLQFNPNSDYENRELHREIQSLQDQIINYQSQLKNSSSEIIETKQELQAYKAKVEEMIHGHKESDSTDKIKKMSLDLKENHFKLSKANSKIVELESKVAELSLVIAKAGGGKTEAGVEKARVTHLEKLLARSTQDLKILESKMLDTKKESQKYKADRIALVNELDKSKREIERLRTQLTAKKIA